MSYDLAVWYPHRRLTHEQAGELYTGLCERKAENPPAHPAVEAFYQELTARHPEIDTVPEDRIDDHEYCPWSCALDYSRGHVIMPCVWSRATHVDALVRQLASKHGLAVFDPQAGKIHYPDELSGTLRDEPRQWWKMW